MSFCFLQRCVCLRIGHILWSKIESVVENRRIVCFTRQQKYSLVCTGDFAPHIFANIESNFYYYLKSNFLPPKRPSNGQNHHQVVFTQHGTTPPRTKNPNRKAKTNKLKPYPFQKEEIFQRESKDGGASNGSSSSLSAAPP